VPRKSGMRQMSERRFPHDRLIRRAKTGHRHCSQACATSLMVNDIDGPITYAGPPSNSAIGTGRPRHRYERARADPPVRLAVHDGMGRPAHGPPPGPSIRRPPPPIELRYETARAGGADWFETTSTEMLTIRSCTAS